MGRDKKLMSKKLTTILRNQEWYQSLIEDCQSILTEGIWNYRLTLIKTYHLLGRRILEENDNFKREKVYGEEIVSHVSESLGQSPRTLWRALQFVRKYPDLDMLPEGKNISWHKICNNLLPSPKEKVILPKGKFQVIYADPPWPYPKRIDSKNLYGNVDYHYDTMTIKDLCNMEVGKLADENSVLFIWVATNFLEQSFEIVKSWGFNYKSQMVWVKKDGQGGIGWYFWGDHELLLVATKGSFLPKEKVSSVLESPRRKHSQKPYGIYGIIEKMYPNCSYLELFARNKNKKKNWTYWGDQANAD